MADKDRQDAEGPSLEMPSLGSALRRRNGRPDDSAGTPEPEAGARRARPSRSFAPPAVDGRVAAMITGVVVGLLAVGLTYLGLLGCEGLNGTQSCGGPGLFMLALILALLVAAGALLLKAWRVPDAVSTSLLGVGLITVICLLFLVDVLFSPWMFVVIPLVGAATFALAQWVTATYGDSPTQDA